MWPRLKNKVFYTLIVVLFIVFSALFSSPFILPYVLSSGSIPYGLALVISVIFTLMFIPIGLLHRSSIAPIRLDWLSPLYYNLDPLPSKSESDSDSDTVQAVDSDDNPEQLIQQAESLTVDISNVGEEIDLEDAIDDLSEALRYYRAAVDKIDTPDRQSEIEATASSLRERRNSLKTRLETQTELRESLQAGEESFQEAIRAYVTDDQTLARIRFRQARDRFADATDAIEESDTNLLATPVKVGISAERELPSMQLSKLRGFDSETTAALGSNGITTVTDLTEGDADELLPDELTELTAAGRLSDDMVSTLTVLSWLHTQDRYEFAAKQALSLRYEQAKRGFSEC